MVKQRELLDKFFRLKNPGIEAFFDALLKLQQISLESQPFEDKHVHPFLELYSRYFGIKRVGFWLLMSGSRGRYLKCSTIYEENPLSGCVGQEMYESDFPEYFRFMEQNVAYAANDSLEHPYTKAFALSYSVPAGIQSLMDAPLHVMGKVAGIICAEQTGERHVWTEKEEGSLIHMASQVAALLVTQELERQVAMRTEDLKKSEHEARSLAAKLVRDAKMSALGEMAGSIAHEIKNPMTVILGRAIHLNDRLKKGEVSRQEIEKTLVLIENTSERVLQIIQAMKTYNRDASGDPLVSFSLAESIREGLQMMGGRLESNAFDIQTDIPPNLRIKARPAQVLQILVNLISNAIDANEEQGERWLRIVAKNESGQIVMRFTDSGVGIQKIIVERMFLPLFTTKTSTQSTGLGLSIAKGIAQELGGDLTYDEAAKNTTFVLKLQAGTESP